MLGQAPGELLLGGSLSEMASPSSSLWSSSSSSVISSQHELIANSTLMYINPKSISSSSQHHPI